MGGSPHLQFKITDATESARHSSETERGHVVAAAVDGWRLSGADAESVPTGTLVRWKPPSPGDSPVISHLRRA